MKCDFCNNEFSNKQNLTAHQKRAKYCLKLQGVNNNNTYICKNCDKNFTKKFSYDRHTKICKKTCITDELKQLVNFQKEQIIELRTENELLKSELEKYRSDYKELSDIKNNVQYLTLDHHVKGAEGYAEYALEFPFKNKIVCVDNMTRNKIKYKNEDGDVIEDIGFRKMMEKLCIALKDRSFDLSQEHYEKLSNTFTEKEIDEYNFMETAIAISKYANGKENEFCNQIIKMISKNSIVK